jgi:hypothetical protein
MCHLVTPQRFGLQQELISPLNELVGSDLFQRAANIDAKTGGNVD